MVNYSAVFALLAAIFQLVLPLNGLKLSESFQKCELGDDVCLAQRFTGFLQHSEKYPDLKIPQLRPYIVRQPLTVRSIRLTPALVSNAYWTNITVYGADQAKVREMSGFQPKQPVSNIQVNVLLPHVTIHMNTNAILKFFSTTIKTRGKITMDAENLEVSIAGQAVNVQRDGKNFVNLENLSVENQVSHFKVQIKYENVIQEALYRLTHGVINTSWRMIKPFVDPTINRGITEILIEIIRPIFNEVSMQDFFKMNKAV